MDFTTPVRTGQWRCTHRVSSFSWMFWETLPVFFLICLVSVFGSDCFINGGISFGRDREQTAAHLLVCVYLLFKMGSGCMELLCACFWTNCTTATKRTEQIVLQQQSKLNRLANICVLSVENLLDHVEDYSLGFENFCLFVFNQKNIQMCPRMAVVFVVVVIMFWPN